MGYINQDVNRDKTTTFFGKEGIKMTNAVFNLHGTDSPLTCPPTGSKTIDAIWITKHFTLKAAAIILLRYIKVDHHTIIVDLFTMELS